MKKVSLFLGMVLAASFAMAQNVANTTQNGDENSANVLQTGTANLLNSSQTGDDNNATINQTSTGTPKNEVLIEQGGGIYEANPGDDNKITITQNGLGNYAKSREYKNDNKSTITQIGDGQFAKQWIWASENTAIQSQTGGNGNWSEIAINGIDGLNSAIINQVGGQNSGSIGQGWSGRNHGSNQATISQVGDRNKVSLADYTTFSPRLNGYTEDLNGLGIQQYGSRNNGSVSQGSIGTSVYDNKAALYQFGDDNKGSITQSTDWNTANLVQQGNNNQASLTQESGDLNVINLKQDGIGGEATILQHGSGNMVKGIGLDEMATSFDGSMLDVEQWGTTNTLNLQQADGASATVYQNGTSNVATISQNQ